MLPSLYRAAKLTFTRDIGLLSEDGTIKTENYLNEKLIHLKKTNKKKKR